MDKKHATFWDFYEDVHGVRLRWATEEQMNDEAWLDAQMEQYLPNAIEKILAGKIDSSFMV